MKYLVMTEGTCEKGMIDALLEKGLLKFSRSDLLYEKVYSERQINGRLIESINQLPPGEKVTILRIGDKLSDPLKINELEDRVDKVIKVCTKPEFEILFIIQMGHYDIYMKKKKSKQKPSVYLASVDDTYRKAYDVAYRKFMDMENKDIISLLKSYCKKHGKVHERDEECISNWLK